MKFYKATTYTLVAFTVLLLSAQSAHANCKTPVADAGEQIYNVDYKTMQFCDGTNWVAMGSFENNVWLKNGTSAYYNDGNVGIGLTSPSYKLDVSGTARITGATTLSNLSTAGVVTNTAAGLLQTNASLPINLGGTGSTSAYTSGSVIFSDGTKLAEDNTGLYYDGTNNRLGINKTSPTQTLDVAGGIYSTGPHYIYNTSPTIYMMDSDNRSAMIHTNSNVFYILRGAGNGSTTWSQYNGYWPLEINLETNNATFGGALTAVTSLNSPIYYDSNDATYYADPGSTTKLNALTVNTPGGMWISGKTGTTGLIAGTAQTASAYHPFIRQTTASGHVVSMGGLGDIFGFFGYDSARTANGYDYSMIMNLANGYVGINSTSPPYTLSVGGSIYGSSSVISPIFYDYNNTSYYMDPESTSYVAYLGRRSFSTGHLVGGQNNIGGTDSYTNPIYTIGSGYNPTNTALADMYGIGYTHPNSGFLPSGSTGWGMYVAADGDARVFLDASSGRMISTGAAISPIFYDYNNTGYYLDPNGTSNIDGIRVNGEIQFSDNSTLDSGIVKTSTSGSPVYATFTADTTIISLTGTSTLQMISTNGAQRVGQIVTFINTNSNTQSIQWDGTTNYAQLTRNGATASFIWTGSKWGLLTPVHGSNANGYWKKDPDGTLTQWGFRPDIGANHMALPIAFADTYYRFTATGYTDNGQAVPITIGGVGANSEPTSGKTTTTIYIDNGVSAADKKALDWIAIGTY